MPRLVVFDFDGTLADTLTDLTRALSLARVELGLPAVSSDVVRTWVGEGVDVLIERALPPDMRTPAMRAELEQRYRRHYADMMLDNSRPYAGAGECLEALAGEVLAVCSNKPAAVLERMLAAFGLRERFIAVIGGDTLPFRKPDPRIFGVVRERTGVISGEAWMVGDSAIDVQTGRAGGAHTIGCTYGLRGREELVAAGADFLAGSMAEVASIVLGYAPGR